MFPASLLDFGRALCSAFFLANSVKVRFEPVAEVSNLCCVRSQHENLLRCREIVAASQRWMRPFGHYAAILKSRIHTLRTKCEFALFEQKAAFMRFADLHLGLHTSCTPATTVALNQTDRLSTPLSANK